MCDDRMLRAVKYDSAINLKLQPGFKNLKLNKLIFKVKNRQECYKSKNVGK